MIFEIEEKSYIHWVSKSIEIAEKEVKVFENKKIDNFDEMPYDSLLYSKVQFLKLEGNTFSIVEGKKSRIFRLDSKDMKDVIFAKLEMKQEQYFLKSVLSEKYILNRAAVIKEKTSSLEKIALSYMILFPILFDELNKKMIQFKALVTTKTNQKEIYLNLYRGLNGLIYEIKQKSDNAYADLAILLKEGETKVERRKTVIARQKTINLSEIDTNEMMSERSDSFSMSFCNNEPKPRIHMSTNTAEKMQMQKLEQQYSIISETQSQSHSPSSSIQIESIKTHKSDVGRRQDMVIEHNQSSLFIEAKKSEPVIKQIEPIKLHAPKEESNKIDIREQRPKKKQRLFMEHNLSLIFITMKQGADKYSNVIYNFDKRDKYTHHLKFPQSFITDYLNSFSNKQQSLPITLNEPITTLQRQCEKMINSSYLTKADMAPNKEMKLCNIAAFIFGEMSLDFNRFMEPITPLKGETYEYYDNDLHYRFFAEAVSSNPPISAYIGESAHFIINGDTKQSSKINVAKSSIETQYNSPSTIKLIQSNESYEYHLPSKSMKFQSLLTLSVEYQGTITITNDNNRNDYCTININNNQVTGEVFIDNKVTTILNGSLNNVVQLQDASTKDTSILWKLSKKEKYLQNKIGRSHYYIPSISYNLNNSNQLLLDSLSKTDSRHRSDIREYERGNIQLAQENKAVLEQQQNKEPSQSKYFSLSNNVYSYKGNYWQKN